MTYAGAPRKAIILAAGAGSRLRPITDLLPKPLVPVGNRPMISHVIDKLVAAGIREVGINTHSHGDLLRRYLGDGSQLGVSITWSQETELLGTAGALTAFRDFCAGASTAVVCGDVVTTLDLERMFAQHEQTGAAITVASTPLDLEGFHGDVVVTNGTTSVVDYQLRPGPAATSNLAVAGTWIIEADVIDEIGPGESDINKDLIAPLVRAGSAVHTLVSDVDGEDFGLLENLRDGSLAVLQGAFGMQLPGREIRPGVWAEAGATIGDEALVEGPVLLGADCVIADGARVTGPAILGSDVFVDTEAIVANSVVLPGARIRSGTSVLAGLYYEPHRLVDALFRHVAP